MGVAKVANNWASEESPTLGCSIEIPHDIYILHRRVKRTNQIGS